MAAVLRKRKIIDTHFGDGPAVQQQRSLASFGRVTKAGVQRLGKKLAVASQKAQPISITTSQQAITQPEPKRRRVASSPSQPTPELQKPKKQQKLKLGPSKVGEPRRIAPLKRSREVDVQGSPTQGARAILEAFVITREASPTPAKQTDANTQTPPSPQQDLVELHAAFLSALSLHYAHNGTASPADLRSLCPSIEQLWGKRRVAVDDLRRLLGVAALTQTPTLPSLSIADFGQGKLCIEYDAPTSTTLSSHTQPLPIAALRAAFARGLLTLNGGEFPLADIVPFVSRSSAQNAKGAARLADIKAEQLNARNASGTPKEATSKITPTAAPASRRGASLLDRIMAKEAHAAAQPAGPTPEESARRAALMRLDNVVPVLVALASRSGCGAGSAALGAAPQGRSAAAADLAASLGLGGGRSAVPSVPTVSFTMPAIVQHLQQSLRHPIATEEAVRCVELLAAEVLPRWVSVRRVGALTSVSIRGSVGRTEWMGRIAACLGEKAA